MKVSFIIPAYNSEKTIAACLQSILQQDYPDEFEIIAVDNDSTDNTAKIIKSFDKVIYHLEKQRGRSYARNSGANMAKGEYLAFIDSDVTLEKDWLTVMLKHAKNNIVGIQGIIKPLPSQLSPFLDNYRDYLFNERKSINYNLLKMKVIESPMINTASCIYRRKEFIEVGGFDHQLKRHEDIDLAKRIFLNGHHLQCTQALSYVYFDQSLKEYLKRSFDEGVTKVAYTKKWKSFDYANIPSHIKIQFDIVMGTTIFTLLKSLWTRNPYLFFMGVNAILRIAGRLYGNFQKHATATLTLQTKDSLIYDDDQIILRYNSHKNTLEAQ